MPNFRNLLRVNILIIFFFLFSGKHILGAENKPELIIAAAANLNDVFNEIKPLFESKYPCKLTINFGSSGLLAYQIEQGAPFDVFASADVVSVERLEKKNLILPGTKFVYARGRITLWQRKNSPIQIKQMDDLTNPAIKRIAIANPVQAPYGQAAKEALQTKKLWDQIQDKIVYGENIRQTKQYAESGNVDAAIIALSISKDNNGQYFVIDSSLHKPINQAIAVINRTKQSDLAKKFCDFIQNSDCQTFWDKFGYEIPDKKSTNASPEKK